MIKKKTILCRFYCRLQGLHISQFAAAEKKNGPRKQTFMDCLIYVTLHYSELGITLRNSQIQKNNWHDAMIDINGPHAMVSFPPIKKPLTK